MLKTQHPGATLDISPIKAVAVTAPFSAAAAKSSLPTLPTATIHLTDKHDGSLRVECENKSERDLVLNVVKGEHISQLSEDDGKPKFEMPEIISDTAFRVFGDTRFCSDFIASFKQFTINEPAEVTHG